MPTGFGWGVKWMDGTTVTLPDTAMNQAEYPQQSAQKPDLGFPIARLVGLLCAATGAVLDAAISPYSGKTGSEHALFRKLLGSISVNDLILADRYYCAYYWTCATSRLPWAWSVSTARRRR